MKQLLTILITATILLAAGTPASGAFAFPAAATSPLVVDWYAEGGSTGVEFGYSVAGLGDVNGDGHGDIAVGSPKYQVSLYREGAALAFYGGPEKPAEVASWAVGSGQKGSLFGCSVAAAGDMNKDGFADLLVGASEYNNGEYKTGAAFLYLGGHTGLATMHSWSSVFPQQNAGFGSSVASAGDVNGDGYLDVIVGAPFYSNGEDLEGGAFLFYGTSEAVSGLSSAAGWQAEGNQPSANFGRTVAGAGDLNGDGYDDVLVGAPNYSNGDFEEGAVFVFYGSTHGLQTTPGAVLDGGKPNAHLGYGAAGAGDVNGDGYDDVIAGAPYYPNGPESYGAAFLYLGGPTGVSITPAWRAFYPQYLSQFGWSVAGAGDVNGDGYDDLIVGAPKYNNDQLKEGAFFLYLGSAVGPQLTPNLMAEGDKADTNFGFAVAPAGDVNNDGLDDLLVGSPIYRSAETIMGRAFLYKGISIKGLFYRYYIPMVRK